MDTSIFIDVTHLHPEEKHSAVFDALDKIADGEFVIIQNDHDPIPLYYQLLNLKGNGFSWSYLMNGPEIWKVEIKKSTLPFDEETIGQMVREDIRKAEIFKKFGIDFCCGGKNTLAKACKEKGINISEVYAALEKIPVSQTHQLDFSKWKLSSLADYIINEHHQYVRNSAPLLKELASKAALKHGERIPALIEINNKLNTLLCELATHMKKEEIILFPYIKTLEQSRGAIKIGFETIKDPISAMERDHEAAGDLVQDIRKLGNNYCPPAIACNTHRLLYYKLEEFESDLVQHIHLENNILFPKAMELERI